MPFKTHYSQKSMTCPQFALELGKANKSRNDLEAQVAALQASQADLLQKVAKNSDLIKTLTKDRFSNKLPNDVLFTVYSVRLHKSWDIWVASSTLESSAYFKASASSHSVYASVLYQSWSPPTENVDGTGPDSDDEFDEDAPATGVQDLYGSRLIKATYHIRLSSYRSRTIEAILIWLLTGNIVFNPLRIKGLASKGREGTSPKSVYRACGFLGIPELQALAKDNIISQLNPDIAEEILYSPFAQLNREMRDSILDWCGDHKEAIKVARQRRALQLSLPPGGETPHEKSDDDMQGPSKRLKINVPPPLFSRSSGDEDSQ